MAKIAITELTVINAFRWQLISQSVTHRHRSQLFVKETIQTIDYSLSSISHVAFSHVAIRQTVVTISPFAGEASPARVSSDLQ